MSVYDDTPETAPVVRTALGIRTANIRAIRSSHEYQVAREKYHFQAEHRRVGRKVGEPCWLCSEDIDYRPKYPHPRSWSLDHAVTVKDNPSLMLDPANFRSSHKECNEVRGTDEPALDLGHPAEVW